MNIEANINFTDLTVSEFDRFVDRKKFSILSPRIWPVHILDPKRSSCSGFDICIFQIGITDGSPGGAYQTGVFLRSPTLNLPKFTLKPTTLGQRFLQLFRSKDIDTSAAPFFSENYSITGESGSRIRSLFKSEVLKYFEVNEGITAEANGNSFIIFKYRDLDLKREYSKYIDRAFEVIGVLTGQKNEN
jgi:hypothetical protein